MFLFSSGYRSTKPSVPRFARQTLAKVSPAGQRLLWVHYLQLRVHQLIYLSCKILARCPSRHSSPAVSWQRRQARICWSPATNEPGLGVYEPIKKMPTRDWCHRNLPRGYQRGRSALNPGEFWLCLCREKIKTRGKWHKQGAGMVPLPSCWPR